jgi:hypothetical protein
MFSAITTRLVPQDGTHSASFTFFLESLYLFYSMTNMDIVGQLKAGFRLRFDALRRCPQPHPSDWTKNWEDFDAALSTRFHTNSLPDGVVVVALSSRHRGQIPLISTDEEGRIQSRRGYDYYDGDFTYNEDRFNGQTLVPASEQRIAYPVRSLDKAFVFEILGFLGFYKAVYPHLFRT